LHGHFQSATPTLEISGAPTKLDILNRKSATVDHIFFEESSLDKKILKESFRDLQVQP
jgi:hypothetical protein